MPTVPGLDAGAAAPSAGRASEPSPSGLPHERIAPGAAEPEHPVGRWLARLMSFGQKPTPDPSARERIEPGIASAPAPAAQATPAPKPSPTSAPPPARTAPPALGPPRSHEFQLEPSSAPPDIEASHALPSTGSLHAAPTGPPTRPQVAPNASRIGLAAAGLHEILGAKGGAKATPSARPAGLPRVAGLTAVSAASGPLEPPARASVTPESLTPGEPPYPTLDVTPIAPPARGSFHIEREPVGADTTFAIPRLPPRDAPRPVRVAVPTAADTPRREPVSPPVAPAPATAPPPVAAVPEPPVDFLAEFAASVGGVPTDSTPTPPPPPPAAVATPMRRAGDRAPQAPNSTAPPLLPSVLRAAAVTAPATPLPVPTVVPPPAQGLPPSRPAPFAITPSVSESLPVAPFGSPVLRAPTLAEPMAVAASEVAAQMRELSLPASDEPATDDVPDGMLVTTPSAAFGRGFRSRRGPWPGPEELEPAGTPPWRQPWVIGTFVTVLFGVGWFVGHSQAPDNDIHATPMSRVLRSVGLGGARFTAIVDTDPPGAFISVDGKPVSRRTPSTIELMPGTHTLTLSMPDLGEVEVPVKGSRGQKVKVNEGLHGVLEVSALDPALPVKMSLDGEPKGFLPVRVDRLPPGLHEVQFSGPSMQTWGQTVNIGIRQTTTLKTRPVVSPATGVVQVQASLNDENGTAPLTGAAVYVDGEMRGSTPLTLELPRGPHSLRVFYGGETAPVQVIDLPGGNRRFAAFQFGLDSDLPPLRLLANYSQLSNQRSTLVEGSLAGLDWHDLREAWLHVRSGEGLWRRYQMTISEGPQGALLSVNFPTQMFDAQGRVTWYMSAATSQGDEFYTELQRSTR